MLSKLSVKKPLLVVVMIILVIILGAVSVMNIGVDLLPNMNLPYLVVAVVNPGASPELIEKEITTPVENGIATVSGVKNMMSTSSEHVCMITLELNPEASVSDVKEELQEKMKFVQLPDNDFIQDPIILELDPSLLPIMRVSVGRAGHTIKDSTNYYNEVMNEINSVDGVANVSNSGMVSNMAFVNMNSESTTKAVVDFMINLLGIDMTIPADVKDTIATNLRTSLANIESNPDVVDPATNKVSPVLVLDKIIVPEIEAINSMVAGELKKEGSVARKNAVDAVTVLLDNKSLLSDAGEPLLYGMIDDVFAGSVESVVNGYMGSLMGVIDTKMLDTLLLAQDFDMPAGSISIGETSYIVKIGDGIETRDEFMDMPVVSIDLGTMMKDQVARIETMLRMLASSPSGNVTITDAQLDAISQALEFSAQRVDNYGAWAVNFIGSFDDTSVLYLDETARANYAQIINDHQDFKATVDSWAGNPPLNWRTTLIDLINSKNIFPDSTFVMHGTTTWNPIITTAAAKVQIATVRPGMANVESMLITLDTSLGGELQKYLAMFDGMTKDEIKQSLTAILLNGNSILGDGAITQNGSDFEIDFKAINQNFETMRDSFILPLKMKDLGNISFFSDASKQNTKLFVKKDGKLVESASVQLSIEKEPDKSTAEISKGVNAVLEQLAKEDSDFTYTLLQDDGEYISFMLKNVIVNLLTGGALAILILLFFLKNLKSTLVVGFSIVVSVVFTFVIMYFAGITLNIVSMGGLALGVGMLVDNSIVVLENIFRLRSQGKSVYAAAIQGAKQVGGAIVASTLTTVIVFLPIAFIEGITKQIFTDMALTICFALLASLIVALTFVPMCMSTFMKKPAKEEKRVMKTVKKSYAKVLSWSLNNKAIVMCTVLVLLASSVVMSLSLGTEFFPATSSGSISVTCAIDAEAINIYNENRESGEEYYTYEMAELDAIERMSSVLAKYESDIATAGVSKDKGLQVAGISLGNGTLKSSITMVDEKDRSMKIGDLSEKLEQDLNVGNDDLIFKYTVSEASQTDIFNAGTDSQDVMVYGEDNDLMREQASILAKEIEKIEGVTKVTDGSSATNKEYKIIVDKAKANAYGLTVAQVFFQVAARLGGPSELNNLRLYNEADLDSQSKQDVGLFVYDDAYDVEYWYNGLVDDTAVKVHFRNNTSEVDFAKNQYFAVNETKEGFFIRQKVNGVEDTMYVPAGGEIPLVRDESEFKFEIAEFVEIGGVDTVVYTEKVIEVSDFTEQYLATKLPIDIVVMDISSENLLNPDAEKQIVPLYKLLDDKSFKCNDAGEIMYRPSVTGEKVPVAINIQNGYSSINHIEKIKSVTVKATYDSEVITKNEFEKELDKVLAKYNANDAKPATISAEISSIANPVQEVFDSMILILILAIVLIYLIMVAQFQSWKSPFIVMGTIPLAFTGSFILLAIVGMKLSVVALIGLVILMGVVVNNGIVFVDYANKLIASGVPKREALIRTGVDRLRPILMTAFTTIFAMLMMAVDGSEAGAMLQPLAVSVIGGLSYATIVTLVVIPIMYDLFNNKAKQTERQKALRDTEIDKVEGDETDEIDPKMKDTVLYLADNPPKNVVVSLIRKMSKAGRVMDKHGRTKFHLPSATEIDEIKSSDDTFALAETDDEITTDVIQETDSAQIAECAVADTDALTQSETSEDVAENNVDTEASDSVAECVEVAESGDVATASQEIEPASEDTETVDEVVTDADTAEPTVVQQQTEDSVEKQ